MTLERETIAAISTPPGRGGIGIVRLSGDRAVGIAAPMLRFRRAAGEADHVGVRAGELAADFAHAQARLAEILDPETGGKLDDAVVTCFRGPRSYTGEDIVEIAAHGSPVVLEKLVRQALAGGARLAEPGEFTERAFLSGRLDLLQAEAVRDLIEAQTLYQAQVAARQMGGALSARIRPVKARLVELIALLEAGIDFAEDDVDVLPDAAIVDRLGTVRGELAAVEASFVSGRIVHNGLALAIVGRPNAGKSSLFNRLVERERAIVTAAPGTTRDLVTERVSMGGIPVELTDTAGLREAAGEAESIGIAKSREAMAEADVVLAVLDATEAFGGQERELLEALANRRAIVVVNKTDLMLPETAGLGLDAFGFPVVLASALTGDGVARLKETILSLAGAEGGLAQAESGMLTSVRQHEAVKAALDALARAEVAVAGKVPHEMLLLDFYAALSALDSLTGETAADDILNLIFSTFCIGK